MALDYELASAFMNSFRTGYRTPPVGWRAKTSRYGSSFGDIASQFLSTVMRSLQDADRGTCVEASPIRLKSSKKAVTSERKPNVFGCYS